MDPISAAALGAGTGMPLPSLTGGDAGPATSGGTLSNLPKTGDFNYKSAGISNYALVTMAVIAGAAWFLFGKK